MISNSTKSSVTEMSFPPGLPLAFVYGNCCFIDSSPSSCLSSYLQKAAFTTPFHVSGRLQAAHKCSLKSLWWFPPTDVQCLHSPFRRNLACGTDAGTPWERWSLPRMLVLPGASRAVKPQVPDPSELSPVPSAQSSHGPCRGGSRVRLLDHPGPHAALLWACCSREHLFTSASSSSLHRTGQEMPPSTTAVLQ